ncbi:MAG TPA: NUDIX domain-containing protein [Gemmatimonadales bacterium]|nr:NUDIX domain-containing protein [Gemmatimonadales bacterium]
MIHEREAVRAIVISPAAEVLLMQIGEPGRTGFWVTPGGGVLPGESAESALQRELGVLGV